VNKVNFVPYFRACRHANHLTFASNHPVYQPYNLENG